MGEHALLLWFDVEIGYKTTIKNAGKAVDKLWFDVEIGYKTTSPSSCDCRLSCGLM